MKFDELKPFEDSMLTRSLGDVISYLRGHLQEWSKGVIGGLGRLSFKENFNSFEIKVVIPAGTELRINNLLRDKTKASQWIMVRNEANGKDLEDGDKQWTTQYVYLKNSGGSEAKATILFLR